MDKISISIYLDKRVEKASGGFPVKLRVYFSKTKKRKLYPTSFEFTESEFESVWVIKNPRGVFKTERVKIKSLLKHAISVADELETFSFSEFESKLFVDRETRNTLDYHYSKTIEYLNKQKRIGTAESYGQSRNSLKEYVGEDKFPQLTFEDVDQKWLEEYENHMINDLERSITTVGIYLRALRAIFNNAIAEKDIDGTVYPFGKRAYQIPSKRNVKKALSSEQLNILFNAETDTYEKEKAKDFFFLSYALNGINFKDLANLRYKDIKDGMVSFYRAKTINTKRTNLKAVTAYLNDYSVAIIEKYGTKPKSPNNLIFPIISDGQTLEVQHNKVKDFTNITNRNLKRLAVGNGLTESISTYYARHSYATSAIRNGASLEFIQESLGHNDMKTTLGYFAGFEDETKKEFANKLMDF